MKRISKWLKPLLPTKTKEQIKPASSVILFAIAVGAFLLTLLLQLLR